ncbi:MAG: pilus assembly protein PilM [Candidatus Paceibacterota bacterium]|jgi:type IV pilus assembly protein PilM
MRNPFKIIWAAFHGGGESVIGIDVGSSSIKVIQIRSKNGRAILETYGNLALGPSASLSIGQATNLPAPKLNEALKDIITESHVTTKKCGIAVSISSSLVSVIEMPAVSMEQLAQMIPIEARKYIPVPITEVSLDWSVIPNMGDKPELVKPPQPLADKTEVKNLSAPGEPKPIGKLEVLLVVIHNTAISKYKELVRSNALDPGFLEIEIFSTIRAALPDVSEPIVMFDMGAGTTKMYVVENGIVRNSHVINRGAQDITEAISRAMSVSMDEAESLKRRFGMNINQDNKNIKQVLTASFSFIFAEAKKVIANFEEKHKRVIKNAVLTGGGSNLIGLPEMLEMELKIKASMADPFSRVEAPAFMTAVLKEAGPEFNVAIGAALRRLQELE